MPLNSLAIAQFDAQADGYCVWQAHVAIVDAVERGDATAAERLMTRHLDHLEQALLNSGSVVSQNRVAG